MNDWLQHARLLNDFSWIALAAPPVWNDIDKTARALVEKGVFQAENHQKLFHAFGYLKAYVNEAKITEFDATKMSISDRWVDFFRKCDKDNINVEELDRIVSYVMAIPGMIDL